MRLGLGATISKKAIKGKTRSLFSNNKSLNFDSSDEYVDTGFQPDFIHTNATFSYWVKLDNFLGMQTSGCHNSKRFYLGFNASSAMFGVGGTARTSTNVSSYISTDTWIHLCLVAEDGVSRYYIDGVQRDSSTYTQSSGTNPDTNLVIGATSHTTPAIYNIEGNIDEVAIWNTALDADAVTAIYNSGTPTNLSSDSGDYDNSANLQGYWRMGDGTLDEYPLIADQTNATLGSNLWDAGVYDTGTGGWSVYGNNTIENDNGALKITHVGGSGAGAGAYVVFRETNDLSTNLTSGKIYKLSWEAKVNSGSEVGMHIWSGAASTYPSTETNTEFTPNTHYFLCESAAGAWMRQTGLGSGEILWIKNLSIQEVQGNPGLMTNMVSGQIEEDTP